MTTFISRWLHLGGFCFGLGCMAMLFDIPITARGMAVTGLVLVAIASVLALAQATERRRHDR